MVIEEANEVSCPLFSRSDLRISSCIFWINLDDILGDCWLSSLVRSILSSLSSSSSLTVYLVPLINLIISSSVFNCSNNYLFAITLFFSSSFHLESFSILFFCILSKYWLCEMPGLREAPRCAGLMLLLWRVFEKVERFQMAKGWSSWAGESYLPYYYILFLYEKAPGD